MKRLWEWLEAGAEPIMLLVVMATLAYCAIRTIEASGW